MSKSHLLENDLRRHLGTTDTARGQCDAQYFFQEKLGADYNLWPFDITTSDGYDLQLFRVQNKNAPASCAANRSKPVLIQHGLFNDSEDMLWNRKTSFGYYLLDNCFDVWFGNNRGSKYSTTHNPGEGNKDFYDYSFEQMGYHDLPLFFKKILLNDDYAKNGEINQDQKITYFGHSEGTSQMFVALAERNENWDFMRRHVGHFFAVSPIAFLSKAGNEIINFFSKLDVVLGDMASILGVYEVGALNCDLVHPDWDAVSGHSCTKYNFLCDRTDLDINKMARTSVDEIELSRDGASVKQLEHYSQLIKGCTNSSGQTDQPCFQKFDYTGFGGNQAVYGQDTPPQWDLSDWVTPSTFIVGTEDPFATQLNTAQILTAIGSAGDKLIKQVNFEGYGHSTALAPKDPSQVFALIKDTMGF